jgi:hypothetical protein
VAALAATALAACADPTTRGRPLDERAFFGAAHAARGGGVKDVEKAAPT